MIRTKAMRSWMAGAIFLSGQVMATATIGLQSAQPMSFILPAHSFTTSYFIDVDNQAQQLTLSLNGQGSSDIDLFLRYGSPFPDQSFDAPTDLELLQRYAHYRSTSPENHESLLVTPSSREPLRNGRWYIVATNASDQSSNVTLAATVATSLKLTSIQIDFESPSTDCDIAPWNDTTPMAPVGGNLGTTLGQQRRNALQRAADLLSLQLSTPIGVKMHACWEHLGGDNQSATLAHAGPSSVVLDEPDSSAPWLPNKYTWYAIAEAVRLGGASQCGLTAGSCSDADIEAGFNADIGSPTVLSGASFYYGYEPDPTNSGSDFISIAMHELTHGLGFIGLVNTDSDSGIVGAKFTAQGNYGYSGQPAYDDIYDKQLVSVNTDVGTYKNFLGDQTSDADRANAMVSGNGLRWSEATAVDSIINQLLGLSTPGNFPLLYAPCNRDRADQPCSTSPGSTLSHTVQSGDLMNAFYQRADRQMGLAQPMLHALGWSNDPTPIPTYTQPIPSNWYDRTHSGHGFDFQLGYRDALLGDVYFITLYTYDNLGNPEWYTSVGHLVDGVFVAGIDANGNSLRRIQYNAAAHQGEIDPSVTGSLIIDFNQSASAPACRNGDRGVSRLFGVMSWTIGNESGQWCMEPLIGLDAHATPDFNGHWYAGGNDSGWGMEILDVNDGNGPPTLFIALYYPDAQGKGRWAIASTSDFVSGMTLSLNQISGYCRTCPMPATLASSPVGEITLTLSQPIPENPLSGANKASFTITYPGTGGSFARTAVPLTLLSLPTSH